MKRILTLIFVPLATYSAYLYYTYEFHERNILYELPTESNWVIPEPQETELGKIQKILCQDFNYLKSGNQTYIFESQDRKHVLKFFRFGNLKPSPLLNLLPNIEPIYSYKQEAKRAQEKRYYKLFNGFWIGYLYDKKNSGLHYIHLKNSDHLKQRVKVKDRYGLAHYVDLDKTMFVLQTKACPAEKAVSSELYQGNIAGAKKMLRSMLDLVRKTSLKGIYDRDHDVMHHLGFLGNKAVRLDVGRLFLDEGMREPETYLYELETVTFQNIDRFLHKKFPEFRDELMLDIRAYLEGLREEIASLN